MRLLSPIPAVVGIEQAADPSLLAGIGTTMLFVIPFLAFVWTLLYFWTGFALSRVFARTGGEPWKAWVPLLNQAEIFVRGGKPAYALVYCFIPMVAIYGLIVRIAAVHRINGRFGRGAGATVLGIVLPPVWMSVLAWGPEPAQEAADGTVAALAEDVVDPVIAFAPRDASGYAIPVAVPAVVPIEIQPLEAAVAVPAAPPVAAPPVVAQPAPRANWRVELADGTAFDLQAPSIVLGRNPEPATPDEQRIALPDRTRTLSKTHARLVYAEGTWRLSDLASTNGSRVIDASGSGFDLRPGDPAVVAERFTLGEVELRLAYELVP